MSVVSQFASRFKFGDKVVVDDGDMITTVIGFCFYPHDHQVLVSSWNNGALVESWVAERRLSCVAT